METKIPINVKINKKREMKKLSEEKKELAILLEKGKLYYPTSLENNKWSYTNQKNLKSKRIDNNINKEVKIQKYNN
jgi:hypothetical protein